MSRLVRALALTALVPFAVVGVAAAAGPAVKESPDAKLREIPITTRSPEARALYLEGRDLAEKLRVTDGRAKAEAAIAKDPSFALGYVLLATTSLTNRDFFEAVKHAKARTADVTPGERLVVEGLEAGARGAPEEQLVAYTKLVAMFPDDPRAQMLLGGHYFGQQAWDKAIGCYERATALDPGFSTPYNQLGYALRFLERFAESEKAFRRYMALIPDDPNPADSYAELLLKMGRFAESIQNYEKALSLDPTFTASYVGKANNQMLLGQGDAARTTLSELGARSRNPGEKRQALFWTAVSWLHQGETAKALEAIAQERAVADAIEDLGSAAADLTAKGTILLETGSPAEAEASYEEALRTLEKAALPEGVKETARRNRVYQGALVALARGDLATARAASASYGQLVEAKGTAFEAKQRHEIEGRVALAAGDAAAAVNELRAANDQDPRVLYHLGLALELSGDRTASSAMLEKAAEFNAFHLNFPLVRKAARDRLAAFAAVGEKAKLDGASSTSTIRGLR